MFKEKKEIRIRILKRLNSQNRIIRLKKSLKIKELLFESKEFKSAEVILFYLSFDGEVDTYSMIKDSLKMGKTIVVPFIEKRNKDLIPSRIKGLSSRDLKEGPYGIKQPTRLDSIDIERIDLAIIPGVAFDRKGRRLGRGKGYYDRFLKRLHPSAKKIGLAFEFQILPDLTTSPHDFCLDKIISV